MAFKHRYVLEACAGTLKMAQGEMLLTCAALLASRLMNCARCLVVWLWMGWHSPGRHGTLGTQSAAYLAVILASNTLTCATTSETPPEYWHLWPVAVRLTNHASY